MREKSDIKEDLLGRRHSDEPRDGNRNTDEEVGSARRRPDMIGGEGDVQDDDADVHRGDDASIHRGAGHDRPSDTDVQGGGGQAAGGSHGGMQAGSADHAPLFPNQDTERFRSRWTEIQTNFVDEPRRSVEQANDLVAEVTERLTSVFTQNRNDLERQWGAGDEVSTEDLRRTLQRYRSFFERLLSM